MHPDIIWIVGQAQTDLVDRGKDLAIREAEAFLNDLAAQHDDLNTEQAMGFVEGINDAAVTVAGAYVNHDEYVSRTAELDSSKLDFDPTMLLAALHHIVEQGKPLGYQLAVEAAREHRDDNPLPDEEDPDDEEVDWDEHARLTGFANGAEYAARQLVERFGVDPDPTWEPAS